MGRVSSANNRDLNHTSTPVRNYNFGQNAQNNALVMPNHISSRTHTPNFHTTTDTFKNIPAHSSTQASGIDTSSNLYPHNRHLSGLHSNYLSSHKLQHSSYS